MKIWQLKIKNLGPFHVKPVELDFQNGTLADASLVAITGRTGAGKTMLLDAVCVALYGKTPRLDGTGDKNPRYLLSRGQTQGSAEVLFEANGSRYLAEWRVKGKTQSKKLLEVGSEKLLAEGTAVNKKIESILGLDFDAFRRSIMLAQGDFAAFLKAPPIKKLQILEATADIGIYAGLQGALNDKMDAVKADLKTVLGELATVVNLPELTDARGVLRDLDAALGGNPSEIGHEFVSRGLDAILGVLREKVSEEKETLCRLKKDARALQEALERGNQLLTAKSEWDQDEAEFRDAKTKLSDAQEELNQRLADFIKVLDEQIASLSNLLTAYNTRQMELEEQIQAAVKCIAEKPLPADRQPRLTRTKELLVVHRTQLDNQQEKLADKEKHAVQSSSLENELTRLSENRVKLHAEYAAADAACVEARDALGTLLKKGTLEEWRIRRSQAQRALQIARDYEIAQQQLGNEKGNLVQLEDNLATCNESLVEIERQLAVQTQKCKLADAEVSRLEAKRELAVLADPINELRQKLEPGEPCLVCGATEHPGADDVEIETDEQLKIVDKALAAALTKAREEQEQRDSLVQEQTRLQENKRHVTDQIGTHLSEIRRLNGETEAAQAQWLDIYPNTEISSEWVSQQIRDAETAIDALREAQASHEQATHACKIAEQRLANCEENIRDKRVQVASSDKELHKVTEAIEDLKADIATTETRFWEVMPDAFHSLALEAAVSEFDKRIKAVEEREEERDTKQNQLERLDLAIQTTRRDLESAKEQRKSVHANIEGYQREGNAFLAAASEKTGGLTTETEIRAAIENLNAALHGAAKALNVSKTLLTEAQTEYNLRSSLLAECETKLETARTAYLEKLTSAGFTSPVKGNLSDREELGRITAKLAEIEEMLEKKNDDIVKRQAVITNLENTLSNFKDSAKAVRKAYEEFARWNKLRLAIASPRPGALRRFALRVVLEQVSQFANAQLESLTSGRYQLKDEVHGDFLDIKLTVVDKWNANEERPVETLSGGESFLTSFALALGLSEISRGRAEIGSLFLDEGFGTLDAETLDIVIGALESLRLQGRSIFLISHIEKLTRHLPVEIRVEKGRTAGSTVAIG